MRQPAGSTADTNLPAGKSFNGSSSSTTVFGCSVDTGKSSAQAWTVRQILRYVAQPIRRLATKLPIKEQRRKLAIEFALI